MYDQLFEESPMIQKMREEYLSKGYQEGRQEGLQEGEMLALRRMLVNHVQKRYPDLVELAQQQAIRFNNPETLEMLFQQLINAPNASTAHWLLESATQQ
jgi:flagellar biosynthesis/type III secretory pathway protein FliH